MTDTTDTTDPQIRPFCDFLNEQARGKSHVELSEGLRDLVARVKDTGKKGTLTYVVSVAQSEIPDALIISDEIKVRMPEYPRDASLFFTDSDGNLVRSDPNAMVFESLREVPPAGVNPKTGEVTATFKGA